MTVRNTARMCNGIEAQHCTEFHWSRKSNKVQFPPLGSLSLLSAGDLSACNVMIVTIGPVWCLNLEPSYRSCTVTRSLTCLAKARRGSPLTRDSDKNSPVCANVRALDPRQIVATLRDAARA